MKVTIGYRLFLAMAASLVALAGVGLGLVRWRLFPERVTGTRATESVDALADSLVARYASHHGWSFVPADAGVRKAWLRDEWMRTTGPGVASPVPMPGRRLGLLDQDGHYLAGVVASRFLVAFASIDTLRRDLVQDGRTIGYLVIATPQDPDEALTIAFLLDQQANLALVVLVGLGLGALAAALLATHLRRPIRRLVEATRRLEQGRLDTRVSLHRSDELGELAASFDHLAARLAAAEESRRQWVADTSHELRTPLAVLQAQLEAVQDGVRAQNPENTALMLRHVRTLGGLVDTLHQLARADVGGMDFRMQPCDAWSLACESMQLHAERFAGAGLTAAVGASPDRSMVIADADRLRQVFTNLFENSVRYSDSGGRAELHGTVDGEHVHLNVDDSPPGIPTHALARLGERFFRLESSRSRQSGGSGLGLALSRKIVEAHGGRLTFAASPLGGVRATVTLPLVAT